MTLPNLTIPAGVKVQPTTMVAPGKVFLMDYSHPETPMFDFSLGMDGQIKSEPSEVPDGRILACHPDDERAVRDALAVAQERPKWWEDVQAIERAIRKAATQEAEVSDA